MTGEIETEQAGVTEACQTDQPYAIVINGKRRRFEIAPRVSNLWENAFATESFNDDDLEYYERQKEYTEFVFVGEKRTLTVTATFPPDPGAVLKSITLPKTVNGERTLGRMTFEGEARPVIIVNGHWGATERDDLLEIECVRRSRERAGGAGQPEVPGVSVRAVGDASASGVAERVPLRAMPNPPQSAGARSDAPMARAREDHVAGAVPAAAATVYPLRVGKLNVLDELWNSVSFSRRRNVVLSGQVRQILKALYDLGAVSVETAKTKREILARAGIQSGIAISKPFTGGGKDNNIFTELYECCVRNGQEKFGTARTYYLDT